MIFNIIINILIVALFLYSKLLPHNDRLEGSYKSAYQFFDRIFRPVLKLLQKVAQPLRVGQGLAVDTSQIILLIILLVVIKFI
ncbi:MAG: YggT family protein [Prevotellaceae bacterium]|jgi:uncharacterized protein YggT (Ycf19 family)|nr:YggT family protein [Prevotellaceae bacterium]